MNPGEQKDGTAEGDLLLVSRIARGETGPWKEFVDRYTGWALYRARIWCRSHCPYSAEDSHCELASLSRELGGGRFTRFNRSERCDEGMDSYIWIMEQLKKRITRYSAKNGSRLSTFVWSVLNSRELYIDWLRWKYGRVF